MPRSLWVLPRDPGRSVVPTLLLASLLGLVLALVPELGAVRSLGAQEVELPLDRYQALREAAYPDPEPDPEPPVPVAFESARLTLEISEDRALVTQILELTLLDDRWRTLTLPAAGTVLEADLDGAEGFLEGEDGGVPKLRLRGEGRHRIRLLSAVPVEEDETATRATRRLTLPLPAAAAVSGTLTGGPGVEEIEEIEAENGAIFTRDGVEGSGATWRFLAEPGSELQVTLLGPAAAPRRDGRPLRYEALSATAVQVTRTRLHLDAWIEARVLEGQLEALTVPLPAGWDLVRVEPSPPATWDLTTDEDPTTAAGDTAGDGGRLRIEPVQPVSGTLRVYLRLSGAPRDLLDSPLLDPDGAARTRWFTKMHVAGDGLPSLLDPGSGGDAALATAATARVALPPGFTQAPGLLMRVTSAERPPRWQVIWSEGTEVLAAEVRRLLVDVLVGEEGRAFYQMWLETRSSGSPRLTLRPPPGFEVTVGGRDGVPLTPGTVRGVGSGGTAGSLALPLSASQEVQVLYLAGFLPLALPENGPFQVPLPQLSAPARKVEVRVLLPGDREVELADPTRGSGVDSPPRKETPVPRTNLSNQVAGYLAVQTGVGDFLTPIPPGFREIEAVWSALSPDLAPLDLEIDDRRSRKEWF